jgi:hypothetical protein
MAAKSLQRCKVVVITRAEAQQMRERISRMSHPTLHEMTDPSKTVFDLIWLRDSGANYRIERQ